MSQTERQCLLKWQVQMEFLVMDHLNKSYDAAALIVLAMQAGGSADRATIAQNVMGVANAPGTKILPGELAKAIALLKDGKEVDYQGATNVEFSDVGEASGSYKELEIGSGKFNTIRVR